MGKRIDMTGKVIGNWTVIRFDKVGKNRHLHWLCRCICGEEKSVIALNLRRGTSTNCGCLNVEANKTRGVTHGMTHTAEFLAWKNAIDRCTNPNHQSFFRYGMRGISVCDRWLHSFENFFEDMGKKPSPKHTLDRIWNDGNYEPSNCKWSTYMEQAGNRRSGHWIEFNGKKMIVAEWEKELNIPESGFYSYKSRGRTDQETLLFYSNKQQAEKCK